ncbi:MAG: Crp/Fnr family transcriptional regulator [Vulcanimicrobiaceae bacterium]
MEFELRQSVYQPEELIDAAYFPIECVLSVVTRMGDGSMIEVGTIGREGTTAIPLIMAPIQRQMRAFCQVEGRAWKISAQLFITLLEGRGDFRQAIDRCLQAYINMLGQMAVCNGLHSVLERCARWLLMTQDCVNRSNFPMTPEFLSEMLGSRRSGVAVAAAMQGAGYIRYAHGQLTILDRAELEATTCESYTVAQDQFNSLLHLRTTAARPRSAQRAAVPRSLRQGAGRGNRRGRRGDRRHHSAPGKERRTARPTRPPTLEA